ncbi:hypothetical protein NIES932_23130 [Raphidiopsis curvata NIES-932]|nr:hypothetical protein NIES932_23130 [Raphidiopsis curvata NIES-932]
MNLEAEYDLDFYAWINKNVELLRCGCLSEIDAEHIAQELESMGKRDRSINKILTSADIVLR